MVRKWETIDEVEYALGRTFNYRQRELIQKYIETGERPFSPGCMWCDEQEARLATGLMDIYLATHQNDSWPWNGDESELDTKN